MRLKRILIALLAGVALQGASASEEATKNLYSTVLWDMNGKPVSLEGLKGKQVLLNFYASWCAGCRLEVADLNKLKTAAQGRYEVVGVSLDTDTQVVRNFAATTGMNYFSLVSGSLGPAIMRALGNEQRALPYSVLIDSSGAIKFTKLGTLAKKDIELLAAR